MKNLLVLLLITTSFYSFKTLSLDKNDLIGKWKGDDTSEIGYLSFIDEQNAIFEIGGQIYGGEAFEINGKTYNLVYTTNFSSTPAEIDFILTDLETKEVKTLLGIVKFVDKNTINFALGFQGERPQNFKGGQSIVLNRVN